MEVHHDNDVRWSSETGWWRGVLKSLGCRVSYAVPRRPESNGIAERRNQELLKTMRIIMKKARTKDWLKVLPYAVWMLNNRTNKLTGFSPAELFLGRPTWQFEVPVPDGDLQVQVKSWLDEHLKMQDQAVQQLRLQREKDFGRRNAGTIVAKYVVGDFALVHKN